MQMKTPQKGKCAFWKGWKALNDDDKPALKEEIKKGLGITTDASFYEKRKGRYDVRAWEAEVIMEAFGRRGITDIWGE